MAKFCAPHRPQYTKSCLLEPLLRPSVDIQARHPSISRLDALIPALFMAGMVCSLVYIIVSFWWSCFLLIGFPAYVIFTGKFVARFLNATPKDAPHYLSHSLLLNSTSQRDATIPNEHSLTHFAYHLMPASPPVS